jgi:hypothetical protein
LSAPEFLQDCGVGRTGVSVVVGRRVQASTARFAMPRRGRTSEGNRGKPREWRRARPLHPQERTATRRCGVRPWNSKAGQPGLQPGLPAGRARVGRRLRRAQPALPHRNRLSFQASRRGGQASWAAGGGTGRVSRLSAKQAGKPAPLLASLRNHR